MTTLNEAAEAIYQSFETAWGATSALTFDNEEFDPPDNAPFVRLTVRHNGARQDTIGRATNRKFGRTGSVFVQIFTLANEGRANADNLAQTARAVFEGVTLSGTTLFFRNVIVREIGPGDGRWYQVNVEAEFKYFETK